ncbi:MAG: choice-of-anchor F family protein [Thiotrichales bacterium]|nr:MAG: choice-of-anchor F family protein [Thiotrichales bacterium]
MSAVSHADMLDLDMPAIKESNLIFPADMEDWLTRAGLFSWHPVNARLGHHPDRPDPNDTNPDDGLDPGVIYIFPDGATANAWWDPVADPNGMPDGIPDTAVAYIHWVLDNRSGQFPGIMAIADDFNFKSNNCIMSSGEEIPIDVNGDGIYNEADGGVTQPKTCSNPQGASKRFKMVVLKADAPIDLVFNMTRGRPLEFTNYEKLVDFPAEDWFRIYRYIMKFGNGTATDTVMLDGTPVQNNGDRIVSISLELGGYDLDAGVAAFQAAPADLTYELQLCIEDKYFDKQRSATDPQNDCANFGDPDTNYTEVWLDYEYATFSPVMYSLTTDKRTTPLGGYWDKYPAGVNPPQSETPTKIDSGIGPYLNTNYPYDQNGAGQIGQTTTNYFDISAAQAAGAVTTPNMFGYLMYYGVFADGDPGNVAMGIYRDDDGDPSTEGTLHAWWDGSSPTCCFRWGIDPDLDGNDAGTSIDPNAWGILSDAELDEIAARPLAEDHVLAPPRYEFGYMDDLAGLNMDTFIRFDKDFDVEANPQIAIRFVARSATAAGLGASDPGVADGPWVANPVPVAEEFFDEVVPPGGGSSGGLCSYSPEGRFDPLLPGLILAALAYLGWRLKKKKAK